MKTTILTIKYMGIPLQDATVIWGDVIGQSANTNSNGQISKNLDDNFAAIDWIGIRHSSFPIGYTALGILQLEAGKNYEYDIPAIEPTAALYKSNILKEV